MAAVRASARPNAMTAARASARPNATAAARASAKPNAMTAALERAHDRNAVGTRSEPCDADLRRRPTAATAAEGHQRGALCRVDEVRLRPPPAKPSSGAA